MPTLDEQVLQSCRDWLKAAATSAGLTDAQVIPADDDGPRPPLPFLTVKLTASDIEVGEDEPVVALADVLTVTDAGAPGTVYTVTVNGTVVTYTRTGAATTPALVAVDLAEEVNDAVDDVFAEADGATVIVSARTGSLAVSESDSRLTLAEDETPVVGLCLHRMATLSVQGFGATTAAWLERAAQRLRTPAIQELLDDAGLSVRVAGGMQNLAGLLDTSIEPRFLREFEIDYASRIDPVAVTPVETVTVDATFERDGTDPADLETTITADLT